MARFTPQETDDEIRRVREDSARLLGWTPESVRSFSLQALREFVRGEATHGAPERAALARRVAARIDALLASGPLLSAEGAPRRRGRGASRSTRVTPVLRGKAASEFLAWLGDPPPREPRTTPDDHPRTPTGRTMKPNPRAPRRTEVIHVIQVNTGYGYGWEDVSTYPDTPEGRKQARADLKEYHASNTGAHRRISRRVDRVTQEPARRKSAKPNGARLKRTKRACAQRGRKLRASGDAKAASRLARYCPPPGRRKKNAADSGERFPYETLDGNMSPATVAKLKKLLGERLSATYPIEAHHNSPDAVALRRHGVKPTGVGSYGRDKWVLSKRRMLTLVPKLLRASDEESNSLGMGICTTLDIEVV